MRCHFIQSIVMIAHYLYISSGAAFDINFAIECFFSEHILPHLNPISHWSANRHSFRISHFYKRDIDALLQLNGEKLHRLHMYFSETVPDEAVNAAKQGIKCIDKEKRLHILEDLPQALMTFHEFKRVLSFFDGDSSFSNDANLASCFVLSKMVVIDEVADQTLNSSLTFIDFLEALSRVAIILRLPTADDLESMKLAGVEDFVTASNALPVIWAVIFFCGGIVV